MKITCLVDNVVEGSFRTWAEHGAAFLIEVGDKRLLFDAGQSGTVLLHNMDVLGVKADTIDALVLSHAHYDHTGGLPALLPRLRRVPLYAHSELFVERFAQRKEKLESIGISLPRSELAKQVDLHLSVESHQVFPGVYTTGEISDRTEAEGRSPDHVIRRGDALVSDPYRDDLSLVIQGKLGLTVLCGCCHAGLLNTLNHVRSRFAETIVSVVGGLHLNKMGPAELEGLIDRLRSYGVQRYYPSHCTGRGATGALISASGANVVPCTVGTVIEVDD